MHYCIIALLHCCIIACIIALLHYCVCVCVQEDILSRYSLDTPEEWETVLSGGEKQRVAWARLFLRRPTFALLDEASAVRAIRKNGPCLEVSPCLSRACLGKMIVFRYKWLKKTVSTQDERTRQAVIEMTDESRVSQRGRKRSTQTSQLCCVWVLCVLRVACCVCMLHHNAIMQ
jgi:ABC-type arginine transport system ATPase subunit